MQAKRQAIVSIHAAALILSFTGYFASTIALPALDIVVWRCIFAALVIFAILHRPKHWLAVDGQWRWLLICGLLTGLHWVTYFQAMQWAGWGIGTLTLFTFPVLTVLLEPLLSRQGRIELSDVALGALALFGVWQLLPNINWQDNAFLGVLSGLVSALLWACRNIWVRQHLRNVQPFNAMAWQMTAALLVLLPFISTAPSQIASADWLALLILAAFVTALPHSLIVSALRNLPAKSAGLIACIQPAYAVTWGFLLLNQQISWNTVFGGSCILAAAIIETRKK